MQRYAAWKAADIRKAVREGRTPTPGPPGDGGDVGWNFEKWLIAGDGRVVARWGSAFDGAAIEREVVQVLGAR